MLTDSQQASLRRAAKEWSAFGQKVFAKEAKKAYALESPRPLSGKAKAALALAESIAKGSKGKARALFWDFWKNLALAAGFLLIVFGTDASSIAQFFAHPTIQSHPYRLTQEHERP
jgi:hypothetical protein